MKIRLAFLPVLLTLTFALPAAAQFSVLYNFCSVPVSTPYPGCADGAGPNGGVILDPSGNLYGTTEDDGANYQGIVFKLDPSGNETVLYNFCSVANCADGGTPLAALIRDAPGNLYGTTVNGGANLAGTVFKLDISNNETVLHSFASTSGDGATPDAGLFQDATGNLYGTTESNGEDGGGNLFMVDPSDNYSVLYNFCCSTNNYADGDSPRAAPIRDAAGNLYGTTLAGGASGGGTVFKLDPAGNYTVLYNFCSLPGCADGNSPNAALIRDAAGDLYGVAGGGGANSLGTVFKLDPAGNFSVLHTFGSLPNNADGAYPLYALLRDAAGSLYGTAGGGGANGAGTVFKIDPAGNFSVLYNFCSLANCADGTYPDAALIQDAVGNLFGTAGGGGTHNGGTVFKIAGAAAAIPEGGGTTPVVINWPSPAAITYGTPLSAAQLDASTDISGTFVYSPALGTVLPAGTQTLSVTFYPVNTTFYATMAATVQLVVNKAVLTVQGNAVPMTYGNDVVPNVNNQYAITGYVNGDTLGVVMGKPTVTPGWGPEPDVGQYPLRIGMGTLNAANYSFNLVDGQIVVFAADIYIKPNGATMKYGSGSLPKFGYVVTGLKYGQTKSVLSAEPQITTTATAQSHVASYPIKAGGPAITAKNYNVYAGLNGILVITPATLTARANNLGAVYNQALPNLTYTVTGLVNGDLSGVVVGTAILSTPAMSGSPVGTYPITFAVAALSAGNDYNVTYADGNLTVRPQ
jgi:uncharacterized repeat protein (TIGR03803 family)